MATSTNAQVRKPNLATRGEKLPPPLKWAGGKRWLVPHIQAYWKNFSDRRLVEPFCGGLAVALGLRPERALLNDINAPLMNFYAWLKKGLSRTRIVMRNEPEAYYAHRERFNALLMSGRGRNKEAAELFYYLNRTGLQRPLPLQRQGGVQRPLRALQANQLREGFHALPGGLRRLGVSLPGLRVAPYRAR